MKEKVARPPVKPGQGSPNPQPTKRAKGKQTPKKDEQSEINELREAFRVP